VNGHWLIMQPVDANVKFVQLFTARVVVGILSGKRDLNSHNPRSERDALPIEATARGNPGVYASVVDI
jgi:hypothetical protein